MFKMKANGVSYQDIADEFNFCEGSYIRKILKGSSVPQYHQKYKHLLLVSEDKYSWQ